MNNEEKVLSLLEQMNGRMDRTDEGFDRLEKQLTRIDARLNGMDEHLHGVEEDLAFVRNACVRMEIDHGRQLKALFDLTQANTEKLEEHSAALGRIEDRLDRLEVVQEVHTAQIQNMA